MSYARYIQAITKGLHDYVLPQLENGQARDSRVTCSGRFDLPTAAPVDLVKGAIEAVYDTIVHDIAATIRRRSAS